VDVDGHVVRRPLDGRNDVADAGKVEGVAGAAERAIVRGQRTDVGASPRSGPIITPSAQNRATESGQEPVAAGTDAPVGQERLPDWPDWPDSQDIVAAMVHSDVESF